MNTRDHTIAALTQAVASNIRVNPRRAVASIQKPQMLTEAGEWLLMSFIGGAMFFFAFIT